MKIVITQSQQLVSTRAFTLIEVLIAILVLAIGLLGLGAVFPAVIAEQRNAFAVIEGENTASSAEAMLNNREFIDFALLSQDFNRPIRPGPVPFGAGQVRYSYEWVVPPSGVGYYSWTSPVPGYANFLTGLWTFNSNDSDVNSTIDKTNINPVLAQIPVSARLFPQPYSGKAPQYVWDLALRREPSGDRLQAAIFVRRIDARIRIPKNESLSDVLTGVSRDGQRLPVAIDPMNGRIVVDDGNTSNPKVYAAIQTLEVEVHPEHLDWLIFPDGRNPAIDTSVGFAAQVGQKLLDNTGVVRTVVGLPAVLGNDPLFSVVSGGRVVQVDPPFTASQAGADDTDDARSNTARTWLSDPKYDDERASYVRQVIFTPRTPVAIRVVTLEESR